MALEQARALRPDVVLMDVQMPVMDGIEATRALVAEDLGRVVILTTFDRDDYVFDGLAAGASGFLLKNAEPEQLVDAVRAVGHGHALLAPEVTRRVIARMTPGSADPADAGRRRRPRPASRPAVDAVAGLTAHRPRARGARARGHGACPTREIAGQLFLGEATVKTHVSNCLAKLHLRDRVQAVVLAYEAGLVLPAEGDSTLRGDPRRAPRLAWTAWDGSRRGADPQLRRGSRRRRRRPSSCRPGG